MRAAGLFALGTILNLTYADVVCKTEKPSPEGGLPGSEVAKRLRDQTAIAEIEYLCNAIQTEEFVAHQFGSTLFTITRTDEAFRVGNCKGQFDNIVEKCIVGQNVRGGDIITDGLVYEVHHGVLPAPTGASGALGKRTPAKAAKKGPAPKKSTIKEPTPKKPTPKKPAPKKPAPKSCPMKKPGAKKPTPKKPAKKTTRDVLTSVVSKFFRRTSPTPSELSEMEDAVYRCEDQPMAARAGWGETFFGFYKENPNRRIARSTVTSMARQKYEEVMLLTNDVTIVAALYVPGDGIYFGSIAHGAGEAKFASTAASKAPRLWSKLASRKPIKKNLEPGEIPSLYHAEDVAMYNYESENLQVKASERYPFGTFIAAYGHKKRPIPPGPLIPCNDDDARVEPNCMWVLNRLNVEYH